MAEILKKDPNLYPRSMQFPTIHHRPLRSRPPPLRNSLIPSIHQRLYSTSLYHPNQVAVYLVETHETYSINLVPYPPSPMEIHTDESLCQVPERSVLLRGGGCGGAQPPLELLSARQVGPPPARPLPRQRRAQRPRPRGCCGHRGHRGRLRHGEPELEARRHGRHRSYNQQQLVDECFMEMLFS